MWDRLVFLFKRLGERLWIRPLIFCVLSVGGAFFAKAADNLNPGGKVPNIAPASIETLLSITAGSMLVIATLAVASMVAAYASAGSTATPRSFSLLVSDDLSQNALSTFLGAFIFTFVALIALKNNFYANTGLFVLFVLTVVVLAFVVVTFVRWVDWIARLGRIGTTIEKVETAGTKSFERRRLNPRLGGAPAESMAVDGVPVFADAIGYVRHINVDALQTYAAEIGATILVNALPGVFAAPGRPIANIRYDQPAVTPLETLRVANAFDIGDSRIYDDDPRFSLVALSEIASRALSPAVNDPGTAIEIFGSFIRLFSILARPLDDDEQTETKCDRVLVPELSIDDLMDDAFNALARDGAALVEVQIRLQKALAAIASMQNPALEAGAQRQSQAALERARNAIEFRSDIDKIVQAASWSLEPGPT